MQESKYEAATETISNEKRKVFFGLFVFPMLIAVTMAVLLSGIVLLTHEEEMRLMQRDHAASDSSQGEIPLSP